MGFYWEMNKNLKLLIFAEAIFAFIFIILIIFNGKITGEVLLQLPIENKTDKTTPEPQDDYFNVTRVIDGDTIDIETGERVRLICIDTPEYYQDYYNEATEFLEDLILGKEVKLVKDVSEFGKYNRLVRYVYLRDGTFVNELIVKEGYGEVYWYEPDITLCHIIQEAENYAKRNDLGMWEDEDDDEKDEKEEIEEEPETESEEEQKDLGYVCDSNFYNCGDFSTHLEAQEVFEYCGGVDNDIHRLDRDKDGIACESLP